MRSLIGWLLILVGCLIGLAGAVLIATGYLAIIGLPLLVVAVLALAFGLVVPAPRVELLGAVPPPSTPLVVGVVGVGGFCPQGYGLGSSWRIDGSGRITPPLCRSAADALSPVLFGQPGAGDSPVVCHCPFGNKQITFSVTASRHSG